ncbi:MAG: hypothetical protein ACF8R7_08370 [Phycisphaerales bacterium JB039]
MTGRHRSTTPFARSAVALLACAALGACASETIRGGIVIPAGAQARGVFLAHDLDLRNLGPGPAELTLQSASGRRSIRATLGPDGVLQTQLPDRHCTVTIAATGDKAATIAFTGAGAGGAGYQLAIDPEQPPKTGPESPDSGRDSGT